MSQIEDKALNLLEAYNLDCFPIDVYELCEALEINILENDFEDGIAGLLYYNKADYYIGVNKHHHSNRKRFTIAHEIGHHALNHITDENDVHVDSKLFLFRRTDNISDDEIQEREANEFAASLLMPASLLKKYIQQESIDLNNDIDIYKLANKLKVSEQALTYRLLNLGLVQYR